MSPLPIEFPRPEPTRFPATAEPMSRVVFYPPNGTVYAVRMTGTEIAILTRAMIDDVKWFHFYTLRINLYATVLIDIQDA